MSYEEIVLTNENFPSKYVDLVCSGEKVEKLKAGDSFSINDVSYTTIENIGVGGFGKIFRFNLFK